MPKIAPHWVLALAAALAAMPVAAVESIPDAASAYRLNVEPSTFRLAGKEPGAPSGPREEPAIPAQLADKPFAAMIRSAARDAGLDPALVHAVIFVESGYNPAARSPKGALGLMQVLPETALRYGVTRPGSSPEANLKAGTRYLSDLMSLFDQRLDLVLAAYNAGEKAVLRHGQRIPPYRETQLYVPAVLAKYHEWRQEPPIPVAPPARIEYLPGVRLDLSRTSRNPQIFSREDAKPAKKNRHGLDGLCELCGFARKILLTNCEDLTDKRLTASQAARDAAAHY